MKYHPVESRVPPNSRAAKLLEGASYYDAWSITSGNVGLSALEHFIAAAKRTPKWIDVCMAARNRAGRLVGLKDLGALSAVLADKPASAYKSGERVGIFTVFENSFDEAIVGDKDTHLNVALSIYREAHSDGQHVTVTVTTIVHVKNLLGQIYMLPVKPMHRLIAPTVLSAIGDTENAA